jgi:hypothetical protein
MESSVTSVLLSTVTVSPLYMNQVPGDCYLYTRQIKQNFICAPLLYRKFNDSRIKSYLLLKVSSDTIKPTNQLMGPQILNTCCISIVPIT